jgi:hypothetical protein
LLVNSYGADDTLQRHARFFLPTVPRHVIRAARPSVADLRWLPSSRPRALGLAGTLYHAGLSAAAPTSRSLVAAAGGLLDREAWTASRTAAETDSRRNGDTDFEVWVGGHHDVYESVVAGGR